MTLQIDRIDARTGDVESSLARLREKLSPRGDVVSEAGRQRTMAVFGEALSPQQVAERICRDVRDRGAPAVLEYTAKFDNATFQSASELRVPAAELAQAHAQADANFLNTIRRIRENIREFQTAILQRLPSLPRRRNSGRTTPICWRPARSWA
jgi:histidinol dehydrogenase